MKFLKQKAVFMIFIMICAIFTIQLIKPVKAESKVCCEKTAADSIYGEEYCIFTEPANCDPNYEDDGVACEQTDYCGPCCCIIAGECNKDTPRSTCLAEEGAPYPGIDCDIPKCQKGCCSLPAECSLVTEAKCAEEIKIYEALELSEVFDPSITSELECQQQCLAVEEGCCVSTDVCEFTSTMDCNLNFPDSQFFKNTICSYLPDCRVTEKHHTGCLPYKDEVYWFDSDGNRENIYGTTYDPDGLVIQKKQSCNPDGNNVRNISCGNCDYSKGSICTEADADFLAGVPSEYKDRVSHMCISLDCETTIDKSDVNPWMDGGQRKHGESWCEYEGAVGGGKDLVGSRHYVHRCEYGREIIPEPCDERRGSICIQENISTDLVEGGMSAAMCSPNLYGPGLACNDPESDEFQKYSLNETEKNRIDCGGECNVYCNEKGLGDDDEVCDRDIEIYKDEEGNSLKTELQECCNNQAIRKKCCEDTTLKDCYWNDAVKMCAPAVPPGNSDNCFGEITCTELWHKRGAVGPWKCKENCESDRVGKCHSVEYVSAINRFCRSFGDCGAHYNVEGKFTTDGFDSSGPDPAKIGLLELKGPKDPKQDPWGDFNTQDKPIEGNLFLAAYVTDLIYSIEMPEDIRRFAFKIEDWLLAAIPGAVFLAYTFVFAAFTEFTFFSLIAETITATAISGWGVPVGGAGAIAIPIVGLVILAIAILIIILFFAGEKTQEVIYTYNCDPWQPLISKEDCQKCMEYSKCDEYKCWSLGSLCEFENEHGEEICVINKDALRDVTPPIITPLPIPPRTIDDFILTPPTTGTMGGYEFKDIIPVYTPLEIGIKTLDDDGSEEYSQCKISRFNKRKYDEMTTWFGNNHWSYEHKMEIPVAWEAISGDEDIIEIMPGQLNTFYVRCQNRNGVANPIDYFIKFTVEDSPDMMAPMLEDPKFSILNNAYIQYGTTEIDLTIYLNEPADPIDGGCKYSTIKDQEYEDMPNNFICSSTATYRSLYTCTATLTNLQNNKDNVFYFKCRDKSDNINDDDLPPEGYHLKGSIPLEIIDSGPSGKVYSNINEVELTIETKDGAEKDGSSTCYYSFTNFFTPLILTFLNTGSNIHSTSAYLLDEGAYTIYTWCRDLAGNEDTAEIKFVLEADRDPPKITKIYEDIYYTPSVLHISTDELATCQYSITGSFTFGTGEDMSLAETTEHEAEWGSTVYYILCQDLFNNLSPLTVIYP